MLFDQIPHENPDMLSPLALAFVGDAVFTLLVKSTLVCEANAPVGKLHAASAAQVNAAAQAAAFRILEPQLDEKELAVFKRGRNAHTGTVPRNMSAANYHCATGLEALLGWLYLSGKTARIRELFDILQQNGQTSI